jgi:hypothetical protein
MRGERQLGKSSSRRKNNSKTNGKDIGCDVVGWILVAQYVIVWRIFELAVNLQVG